MNKRIRTAEVRKTISAPPHESQYYYVYKGANGEIMMSSEMYPTLQNAERGASDALGSDVNITYAEGVKS